MASNFIRDHSVDSKVINAFITSISYPGAAHLLNTYMPEAGLLMEIWTLMVQCRSYDAYRLRMSNGANGAWAWRIVLQIKQDARVSGSGQLFNNLYCKGTSSRSRRMNNDVLKAVVQNTCGSVLALKMSLEFRPLGLIETMTAVMYLQGRTEYAAVLGHLLSTIGISGPVDIDFKLAPTSAVDCPICFETAEVGVRTTCGHEFCHACVVKMMRQPQLGGRCPMCRSPMV